MKLPLWDEFSVARMWAQAETIDFYRSYMPECWYSGKGRGPERNYVLGIQSTLYTEWLKDAYMDICRKKHAQRAALERQPMQLALTDFWANELLSVP